MPRRLLENLVLNIATKKDIIDFLKVSASTLNSFLYKNSREIEPVKLSTKQIKSIGGKARRMNGYHLNDVAKIAFGMDTALGVELKKEVFGDVALECNGYSHRSYDPKEEEKRERIITEKYCLIRFDHRISLETLMNALLRIEPGKIIRIQ